MRVERTASDAEQLTGCFTVHQIVLKFLGPGSAWVISGRGLQMKKFVARRTEPQNFKRFRVVRVMSHESTFATTPTTISGPYHSSRTYCLPKLLICLDRLRIVLLPGPYGFSIINCTIPPFPGVPFFIVPLIIDFLIFGGFVRHEWTITESGLSVKRRWCGGRDSNPLRPRSPGLQPSPTHRRRRHRARFGGRAGVEPAPPFGLTGFGATPMAALPFGGPPANAVISSTHPGGVGEQTASIIAGL